MLTMLKAEPNQKFVDAAEIPKGTRVFSTGEGRSDGPLNGEPLVACFQTLSALRVLPYDLEWVEILRIPGAGFKLLLRVKSDFARNDDIGELNFHINHLNDFTSSSVNEEPGNLLRRCGKSDVEITSSRFVPLEDFFLRDFTRCVKRSRPRAAEKPRAR